MTGTMRTRLIGFDLMPEDHRRVRATGRALLAVPGETPGRRLALATGSGH
jgi:hypothetical protein